jgi:Disaggregatase related repeat
LNTMFTACHKRLSCLIRPVLALVVLAASVMTTQPVGVEAKSTGPRHNVLPGQVAPERVVTKQQRQAGNIHTGSLVTPQLRGIHVQDPIDMKLLVITADGLETDLPAIKVDLDQLGIPYDVMTATVTPLTSTMLWDGGVHGYYEGIILVTGNLIYQASPNNWISAFDDNEWATLWQYESMFGIRQVTSYTYPAGAPDNYGLNLVTYQDTLATPLSTTLTTAGQQVFPYLVPTATIPIKGAWVYLGTVVSPALTTPLVVAPDGSGGQYAIASITQYADGRQNLAVTAANNPYLLHSLLFSYGLINWVTKGLFLGERHVYLSPQPDDLLIDDNIWDTVALTDTTGIIQRMTGADFNNLIAWQNQIRANNSGPATQTPITTCVTIQPVATAGQDTYINSASKSSNYGNSNRLATDSDGTQLLRSLVQFNVTSVPSQSTVISAVLSLYLVSNSGSQTDTVETHRLTRTWVEGNGKGNSGATWNQYASNKLWTKPGGDFDPSSIGNFVASGTGWKSINLTPLVQSWVSGTVPNQGVILLSPTGRYTNSAKLYYSSDAANANASQRPKLAVCYVQYQTVPGLGVAAALTLEFPFVGEGSSGIYVPDDLTPAVVLSQTAFRYINHTYSHQNISPPVDYTTTLTELLQNNAVAVNQFHFTYYYTDSMVQPDISGLDNPNAQQALHDYGIKYIIDDTSQPGWNNPSPNAGFYSIYQPSILIIPRHPSNLFYNLVTPAQWVSEYNCYYGPAATCAGGTWKFWDHDLSYAEILDKESDMLLQYMLKWDMDGLMFHQPNVSAYDGVHTLLGDLFQALLAKYTQYYNLPIRSEAEHNLGVRMGQRMAYNAAGVTGSLVPCTSLTLTAQQPALVPVTGVVTGTNKEVYGGQNISYIQLQPNTPVTVPVTCQ